MDWKGIQQEVDFRTSRSSGAGGQHVNKTETRVEVLFDLGQSRMLTEREKRHVRYHHKRLVDERGIISLTDQSSRSQHGNRAKVLKRLKAILETGTKPIPKKHKGKAFVAHRGKRLNGKKRRSDIKASRGKVIY